MEVNVEYGKVFEKTLDAYSRGKKIIIHKGGTGSGKTFDIMIFLIFWIALKKRDWIITIVSESRPHLDIGVIRILRQLLINANLFNTDSFNATSGRYTLKNGTIIEFFSADRIDKALGARRNVLYGNEINSLKFEVWDELARRSEFIFGDFNPTFQFWLEKFLQYYDNTEVITSNYLDNHFLPEYEIARIRKRASMDPNFKRIHIDCEYGSYEGLVFTEFNIVDTIPEGLNYIYGLDFGFTNDPTALLRVGTHGECLYIDELIYRTGLTNADTAKLLSEYGITKQYDEIIADSAEPKSIEELYRYGYNIKPALKGPDSIRQGIDTMKQFKIFVTKHSVNLIREFRNYSWIMDKAGNPTNKPSDIYNHAIDAVRYALSKVVVPETEDYYL